MSEAQVVAIIAAILYAGADGPDVNPSYTPEAAVKIAHAILKAAKERAS